MARSELPLAKVAVRAWLGLPVPAQQDAWLKLVRGNADSVWLQLATKGFDSIL